MAMMRLALLAAAASTASAATPCCMALPSCPSGYEQSSLYKCSLLDFFAGTCTAETLCCSTIVCRKKAKETCRSNDDCDAGFACRFDQEQDPVSGNVKCLDTRSCVPRVNEGERCNGFTLPCMTQTCQEGLQCECVEATCDVPGYCRKPKSNTPAPASNACGKDLPECATGFACRFDQEVVNGNVKCLNTMSCVPRVGEGEGCNGYTLPCTTRTCLEGLTCKCVEATCDAPGVCTKPTTL